MNICILLFDRFTFLDVVGPYEVLARMPDAKTFFCARAKGLYRDSYGAGMPAEFSLDEIKSADILLIPGGYGVDDVLGDKVVLGWIKDIDITTRWTISVCSGSIILAAAGVVNTRRITTHWRRKEQLKKYNVKVVNERYVQDGKYLTSAGVSAGIDMALYLVSQIGGEELAKKIQVGIEYDPLPPFKFEMP